MAGGPLAALPHPGYIAPMSTATRYPRDLRGYGRTPPFADWPGAARVAVQFVLNLEEGGENCVLHGDPGSEQFLSEIVGAQSYPARHMSMESVYEYGSRVGAWRILREFERRGLPLTVFGVAMAMQRNPELVRACMDAGHEIASHGAADASVVHLEHFLVGVVIGDPVCAHDRARAPHRSRKGCAPQSTCTPPALTNPITARIESKTGAALGEAGFDGLSGKQPLCPSDRPAEYRPRPLTVAPRSRREDLATRWETSASLPQKRSLSQPTAHAARAMTGVISGLRSLPCSGYPISVRSVSRAPSPQGSPS